MDRSSGRIEERKLEVRMVMKIINKRKREREIPKKKWMDTIENDMRIDGVCIRNVGDSSN